MKSSFLLSNFLIALWLARSGGRAHVMSIDWEKFNGEAREYRVKYAVLLKQKCDRLDNSIPNASPEQKGYYNKEEARIASLPAERGERTLAMFRFHETKEYMLIHSKWALDNLSFNLDTITNHPRMELANWGHLVLMLWDADRWLYRGIFDLVKEKVFRLADPDHDKARDDETDKGEVNRQNQVRNDRVKVHTSKCGNASCSLGKRLPNWTVGALKCAEARF